MINQSIYQNVWVLRCVLLSLCAACPLAFFHGFMSVWSVVFAIVISYFFRRRLICMHSRAQRIEIEKKRARFLSWRLSGLVIEASVFSYMAFACVLWAQTKGHFEWDILPAYAPDSWLPFYDFAFGIFNVTPTKFQAHFQPFLIAGGYLWSWMTLFALIIVAIKPTWRVVQDIYYKPGEFVYLGTDKSLLLHYDRETVLRRPVHGTLALINLCSVLILFVTYNGTEAYIEGANRLPDITSTILFATYWIFILFSGSIACWRSCFAYRHIEIYDLPKEERTTTCQTKTIITRK